MPALKGLAGISGAAAVFHFLLGQLLDPMDVGPALVGLMLLGVCIWFARPKRDVRESEGVDGFDRLLDIAFFIWRSRFVLLVTAFWVVVVWAGIDRDSPTWWLLRKILGWPT